jgi:hypothetical protein
MFTFIACDVTIQNFRKHRGKKKIKVKKYQDTFYCSMQ